jgi:catechol 2,3-dioxygenase-like lactoylglutathione lyase family enzyme
VPVFGLIVPLLAQQARTVCGYGAPMTVALFAGIRVRDVTAARAWYEQLLGEPSFFPNATEVVWTVADDRSLYIEEDPRRAGGALITVFVDDLDAVISEIGSRGLEPAERETYSNGVRKATYRDDDGNEIGFGGATLRVSLGAPVSSGFRRFWGSVS